MKDHYFLLIFLGFAIITKKILVVVICGMFNELVCILLMVGFILMEFIRK
jgi:hypothetical protein